MGGNYPCHCGAAASGFARPSEVLKPCHYCEIRERGAEFNVKPEGFTYDTKKLTVSTITIRHQYHGYKLW